MWRSVASNMERYRNYPRIAGGAGGKDFIVAHPSADVDALATAIVRGSFEYQGQKCSASSRVYAPSNLWPGLRERPPGRTRRRGGPRAQPVLRAGVNGAGRGCQSGVRQDSPEGRREAVLLTSARR